MHAHDDALAVILDDARRKVQVGATYAHYKNPERTYVVTGIGLTESAEEAAVVYTATYGSRLTWVRPLSSWLDVVEVDGKEVPRFRKVTP